MSGWSRVQLTTSRVPCTMFSTPLQAACVNHLAHGPCAKCPLQLIQAGGEVQGIKVCLQPETSMACKHATCHSQKPDSQASIKLEAGVVVLHRLTAASLPAVRGLQASQLPQGPSLKA